MLFGLFQKTKVESNSVPPFKAFIDFVIDIKSKPGDDDVHLLEYWRHCGMCLYVYDVIGKMESFQIDLKYIAYQVI